MNAARRQFLKQSLATTAGSALTAGLPSAKGRMKSANDQLIVGLIGCKGMGYADLKDLLQQRSGKHWAEAIQFVQNGQFGKIRRIQIWANFNYAAGRPIIPDEPVPAGIDFEMWLSPAPQRTFNRNRFHGLWRMFWDYGGGLMTDWGVHLLDMGLWAMNITGFPKAVTATDSIYASQGNAVETADTQTVIYEFGDFIMTWDHNAGIQAGPYNRNYRIAFIGTNETLLADRDNWIVNPEGAGEEQQMEPIPPQRTDNQSHVNHVQNFIECVKNRHAMFIPVVWQRCMRIWAT